MIMYCSRISVGEKKRHHAEERREWSRQYRAAHAEEYKERSHKYYEEHKDELNQKRRQKRAEENELSKTDPEVAAKREERLAKQREYNRRYREKKRAEKAEAKAQTDLVFDLHGIIFTEGCFSPVFPEERRFFPRWETICRQLISSRSNSESPFSKKVSIMDL